MTPSCRGSFFSNPECRAAALALAAARGPWTDIRNVRLRRLPLRPTRNLTPALAQLAQGDDSCTAATDLLLQVIASQKRFHLLPLLFEILSFANAPHVCFNAALWR